MSQRKAPRKTIFSQTGEHIVKGSENFSVRVDPPKDPRPQSASTANPDNKHSLQLPTPNAPKPGSRTLGRPKPQLAFGERPNSLAPKPNSSGGSKSLGDVTFEDLDPDPIPSQTPKKTAGK